VEETRNTDGGKAIAASFGAELFGKAKTPATIKAEAEIRSLRDFA
jgi:hypothetical protein